MSAGFQSPAFGGQELQRHVDLLQTGILGQWREPEPARHGCTNM
jgi:hypothetical protein